MAVIPLSCGCALNRKRLERHCDDGGFFMLHQGSRPYRGIALRAPGQVLSPMSDHATKADASSASPKGKSGVMGKLMILAFLTAVIGGECLVACFYLPSITAASVAPVEGADAAHGEHAADTHGEAHGDNSTHDTPSKSA